MAHNPLQSRLNHYHTRGLLLLNTEVDPKVYLILALIIAGGSDIITTYIGLTSTDAQEMHPLATLLGSEIPVIISLALAVKFTGLIIISLLPFFFSVGATIWLALFWLLGTCNNLIVISNM